MGLGLGPPSGHRCAAPSSTSGMNSLCCPRASHRQYSTIANWAQQEAGVGPDPRPTMGRMRLSKSRAHFCPEARRTPCAASTAAIAGVTRSLSLDGRRAASPRMLCCRADPHRIGARKTHRRPDVCPRYTIQGVSLRRRLAVKCHAGSPWQRLTSPAPPYAMPDIRNRATVWPQCCPKYFAPTAGRVALGRAMRPVCRVGHDRQPAPRAFRRAARKVLRIRRFAR